MSGVQPLRAGRRSPASEERLKVSVLAVVQQRGGGRPLVPGK